MFLFVLCVAAVTGADLDRVHRVLETCQRFQIFQIKGLETLKNGKFIDFWGDWNPVTFLMTGFQNKTDSLSFFVSQLGCFIDFKINTSTRRYGRTCVINSHVK